MQKNPRRWRNEQDRVHPGNRTDQERVNDLFNRQSLQITDHHSAKRVPLYAIHVHSGPLVLIVKFDYGLGLLGHRRPVL